MAKETEGSKTPREDRKQRLAEQLRANLQRRKGQTRSRRDGKADGRMGLPAASPGDENDR